MNTNHSSQRTLRRSWRGAALALAALMTLLIWSSAFALPPTVTSVTPNNGPATGGTNVTISGTNFTAGSTVSFGGTPASSIVVTVPSLISATAPARAPGLVSVTVTTIDGTSTAVGNYTYNATIPIVTSISPTSGATGGGTAVTIFGSGFLSANAVSFGSTGASYSITNDTQIAATSPAQAAGTVHVRVASAAGSSPIVAGDQFTYVGSTPTITNVSPTTGPVGGGTSVVITGTNLTGATLVTFGGTSATITFNNATQINATSPAHVAGLVDIIVITPNGTNANTAADNYTYTGSGPVITSISPTSGPVGGGTTVTIFGSGFLGATSVTFGGTAASFTAPSFDTQIIAAAPFRGFASTVDVVVTTASGASPNTFADNYTYSGTSAPNVTNIFPTVGPTTGGTQVTITGSGFTGATSVTFGGAAAFFTVQNNAQIVATAPAHFAGAVNIVVTSALGSSVANIASVFTYGGTGGPVISFISPTSGPTPGGTQVTITGSGFTGATSVLFGGSAAFFTVYSDGQIIATAPAHFAGTVNIVVTTSLGSSTGTAGSTYVYGGGPFVTGVSPNSGPISGGTIVTITGGGFTNTTSVTFGGLNATSVFVVNDSTITATSPARIAGVVDVLVTTALGTSANTSADNFTYGGIVPVVTTISPSSGPAATQVTITGSGFTNVYSVTFGGVAGTGLSFVSDGLIRVNAPSSGTGTVDVIVITTTGTSVSSLNARFTFTSTGTTTSYTLNFRWSLIVWKGADGASIAAALKGQESPDNPATNNVFTTVTAVFRWAANTQTWLGYFPAGEGVPGANDFTTFNRDTAYWIASSTTITWTIITG